MNKLEFFKSLNLKPTCDFKIKKRSVRKEKKEISDVQPKRKRGRPPKSELTKLPEFKLKQLSSSERQCYEKRVRNNEASRRSRLKRKAEEEALINELSQLELINKELITLDNSLDKQLKIWREKIIKLVKSI